MSKKETPALFIGQTQPDAQQFDAWANQPLLMSLEAGGIDWPSSCRNGTCRTCIGQLERGEVRYDIEWPGLSAEEKAQGFVLPCVARPCSDVVLHIDN
jgi:ferredoxin